MSCEDIIKPKICISVLSFHGVAVGQSFGAWGSVCFSFFHICSVCRFSDPCLLILLPYFKAPKNLLPLDQTKYSLKCVKHVNPGVSASSICHVLIMFSYMNIAFLFCNWHYSFACCFVFFKSQVVMLTFHHLLQWFFHLATPDTCIPTTWIAHGMYPETDWEGISLCCSCPVFRQNR